MPAGPPLRDRGVLNVVLPAGVGPADVARPEIDLEEALRDELDVETILGTNVGLDSLLTEHESVENFIRPDVALNVTWPGDILARSPDNGDRGDSPELVVIPPRKVEAGRIRHRRRPHSEPRIHISPPVNWEVFVSGRNNNRPISFLERGQQLASGVGMVVIPGVGFGTCFLVTGDLIMTNNHVLPSADAARGATVVFNFQNRLDGKPTRELRVGLAPDAGFHTSPKPPTGNPSARHLDYSLVKLERPPTAKQRPLILGEFEIAELQDVIVIHHPDGLPKQITLAGTEVQYVDEFRCQYLADTTNGSSGSPIFNDRWELVALHHIGGVSQPDAPNTTRNQGVRITAILDSVPTAFRSEIDDCRLRSVAPRSGR